MRSVVGFRANRLTRGGRHERSLRRRTSRRDDAATIGIVAFSRPRRRWLSCANGLSSIPHRATIGSGRCLKLGPAWSAMAPYPRWWIQPCGMPRSAIQSARTWRGYGGRAPMRAKRSRPRDTRRASRIPQGERAVPPPGAVGQAQASHTARRAGTRRCEPSHVGDR